MTLPTRVIRARRPIRSGNRRKLVWATSDTVAANIAAGANTAIDLLATSFELAGASTLGATVMRTHARISAATANAQTADWRYGFIVTNSGFPGNAATLALYDPRANPELDWMLLDSLHDGEDVGIAGQGHRSVDLRSKRKMQEMNQKYIMVINNGDAAAHLFSVFVRTLIALP